MRTGVLFAAVLTAAVLAVGGCNSQMSSDARMSQGMGGMAGMNMGGGAGAAATQAAAINDAIAVIQPTKGSTISGVIHFQSMGDHVHIWGDVMGLEANTEHAFHIHEFGDASSDDGMAAGGHYNPEGHKHGGPDSPEHHAGDLGNIKADASGKAHVDLMVHGISIAGPTDPIIGRSVVIHAKTDDFVTQPTGNAGGRIGVGVIGVAKKP